MKKRLLKFFMAFLFLVFLFLPQSAFSGGQTTDKTLKANTFQKTTRRQLTQEEVVQQMVDGDIKALRPHVPQMIEKIKKKMANETLCPFNKEDMDIVFLGRARDPRALPLLIDLLKNYHTAKADSAAARTQSAAALGTIGDRSAIPALKEAMNDESRGVKEEASLALLNFGEQDYAKWFAINQYKEKGKYELYVIECFYKKTKVKDEELVKIVIEATKSSDEMTRLQAAWRLQMLGENEKAFPVLKDIAKNSHEWTLRDSALGGLARIGNDESVSIVINALNDSNSSVRQSAIENLEYLGREGNKRAISILRGISINNSDNDIRYRAIESLKRINEY